MTPRQAVEVLNAALARAQRYVGVDLSREREALKVLALLVLQVEAQEGHGTRRG